MKEQIKNTMKTVAATYVASETAIFIAKKITDFIRNKMDGSLKDYQQTTYEIIWSKDELSRRQQMKEDEFWDNGKRGRQYIDLIHKHIEQNDKIYNKIQERKGHYDDLSIRYAKVYILLYVLVYYISGIISGKLLGEFLKKHVIKR